MLLPADLADDGRNAFGAAVPRFFLSTVFWFAGVAELCAQPAVLTWHNDNARSGQILDETLLQPANVNSTTFGRLFTLTVDGNVDAEPLYVPAVNFSGTVHNVLIVATENDSVYAFDADTGAQLWQATMLLPGETTSEPVYGCGQVYPQIGVTSTPVIVPTAGPNGVVYVVAMSKDSQGDYIQRLHALDLVTKAELFGGPVTIQASYPGTGDNSSGGNVIFEPKAYKERAALLLLNGTVYTSWASHCDIQPYTGWVIGYDHLSLQQVSVINLTPNGAEGAIWGSGAGPAADASGYVYLLMANGSFDTTLNMQGFPEYGDYGNAFMKISTAGGVLSVADYFAMDNDVSEDNGDVDLGSGGAMLLPPLQDSQLNTRSLAVGAGKDGHMYVVDTSNMGKFNASSNTQIYQDLPGALPGGIWSAPAWFNGSVYYGSVGNHIQAFPFANGSFSASPDTTSESFGYPGATPSISANGSSNGIVWALENTSPAVLHAYRADDLSTELYNSNQAAGGRDQFGNGNKFITPLIANGKVYAGEAGTVGVFGLLNCAYALDQKSIAAPPGGASGSVNLTTSAGCLWSSYSDAAFVGVNGGGSGSGNGATGYTISANSTGAFRTGHLTIGGQTITVSQGAAQTDVSRGFVSSQGSDGNNCGVSTPCRSLARAVAATNAGGEVVVTASGSYSPVTITEPVTISAVGVTASITVSSGNAITINTPGNVTIRGLELHGQGTGNDGVLVQQVGVLRLYGVTAEGFANDGVEMASAGDLAIYDSRFTDNQNGLAVENSSANAYVHHTSFDHNSNAGVYAPQGVAAAADASAHFNGAGFDTSGGTLVLRGNRAVSNGSGISAAGASAVGRFASCSVALNSLYSYSAGSGGTLAGTNPGSSLVSGAGNGSLASPTVLK